MPERGGPSSFRALTLCFTVSQNHWPNPNHCCLPSRESTMEKQPWQNSGKLSCSWMWTGFRLKPNLSWKYPVKSASMHLTYRTSELSPACLNHAQNTYMSLQLGSYLEFYLKSCLPLLTRSRRHRWVFCNHGEMRKHKIQYPKKRLMTVQCREPAVAPVNSRLARSCGSAAGQHHTSPRRGSLAQEKIKIQTVISTKCIYHFCTTVKSKNVKSGAVCNLLKSRHPRQSPCLSTAASHSGNPLHG